MLGTLDNLLALAHNEVGDTEHPPGSNVPIMRDGTDLWRDFYGLPYEPHWAWCALFQSWLDWRNGTPLPAIDFSRGYIGVDNGRAWFRDHGLLVPRGKPGYLCFYNEHTGRQVTDVDADSWFWSIEGNEGDAVRLVHRHVSELVGGCGVRAYTTGPKPTPPTQEEDMPTEYAPAGGQAIIPITPGRKGAVVVVSDNHPTAGANIRVAVGSDSKGWPVFGTFWVPPHRVGWPIPDGAEVVNVENAGPNGCGVSVEYV